MRVLGSMLRRTTVVGRVRNIITDLERVQKAPGDSRAGARILAARRSGAARKDLAELEDRLERLRRAFPELPAVEVGPLVQDARDYFGQGGEDGGYARLPQGS